MTRGTHGKFVSARDTEPIDALWVKHDFPDRVQAAADSYTPPSKHRRKFGGAALGPLELGNAPIVSAVKFYTYVQAAGKRSSASLARKIVPINSERAFPRHRAPGFRSRCFA